MITKSVKDKIKKITAKSSRTDVLALHEKLNEAEDKAQAAYDKAMNEVHEARNQLNEGSNHE